MIIKEYIKKEVLKMIRTSKGGFFI